MVFHRHPKGHGTSPKPSQCSRCYAALHQKPSILEGVWTALGAQETSPKGEALCTRLSELILGPPAAVPPTQNKKTMIPYLILILVHINTDPPHTVRQTM